MLMHIIEPHRTQRRNKKRKTLLPIFLIVGAVMVVVAGRAFFLQKLRNNGVLGTNKQSNGTSSAATQQGLKYFSGYDFQRLYETTALPNTQKTDEAPVITGNTEADVRIRTIAESRGHHLQPIPKQAITKSSDILSDDSLMQPYAAQAWQKLKTAANKEHIPLVAQTAYRSIDTQRQLFIARLESVASLGQIAAGKADAVVIATVQSVVPPGYSRHHSGYAIDFTCSDGSSSFELSTCHTWLKANNYNQPKLMGFIPSYSDGVGTPPISPELAEYVWVGTSKFY